MEAMNENHVCFGNSAVMTELFWHNYIYYINRLYINVNNTILILYSILFYSTRCSVYISISI